jgi:hypothetical protein
MSYSRNTYYFAFQTTIEPTEPDTTVQESNSLGFEKLTVILLVKKLTSFYGAWPFITSLPVLKKLNAIHVLTSYIFKFI